MRATKTIRGRVYYAYSLSRSQRVSRALAKRLRQSGRRAQSHRNSNGSYTVYVQPKR